MAQRRKPLVLITGAAGRIGSKLAEHLRADYRLVGLDRVTASDAMPIIGCDLSSDESVVAALAEIKREHGRTLAAVIHLAAFFDFTGEDNPLYRAVNVEGTGRLLDGLKTFTVHRFIYTSTILVHAPANPGELITETSPVDPRWAYPVSKAEAENIVVRHAGDVPSVILRLAGIYDEEVAVPTLSQQIARIYERDLEANLYAGDPKAGQSLLHADDMADAIAAAVARRDSLPGDAVILVGEPGAVSYEALQERIGTLIHGEEWKTLSLPKPLAKLGAALQHQAEPLIPDSIDQGERPFIRPFMIGLADDHYALDVTRARELLDWAPRHRIEEVLPAMIERLKADPAGWYRRNGIKPPQWVAEAVEKGREPEDIRSRHERDLKAQHRQWLWTHFANIFLGAWLVASPMTLGYPEATMTWSDIASGLLLILFGIASVDWRLSLARFGAGAVGLWVLFAPLVFWTTSPAAYLNGTIIGALAIAFATLSRPFPLVSPIATQTGPDIPPGWSSSPSTFLQRAPIIALAVVGLFVSRYMTAYQLGHIDAVWEPFFAGAPGDPRNGTEEIITSEVSKAWPVPDAGIGAATYMLEILTGLIGSQRRWRTMPWLVVIFGLMIVPLGIVSITFIIIQPILLGTWCTLCLIAAAAMVVQIPYSVDELVATGQFLVRKHRQKSFLRAFIFGDTDDGTARDRDDLVRPLGQMLRDIGGGVNLPWTLALSILIGIWLMLTRVTLGATGSLADADHIVGALTIVISVTACAEVARPVRYLNAVLGAALLIMPVILGGSLVQILAGVAAGAALIALSLPRGGITGTYGSWDRYLV